MADRSFTARRTVDLDTRTRPTLTLRRALLHGGSVFLLLCGCFTPSDHLANTTPREREAPTEAEIQVAVHGIANQTGERNVALYANGVPDAVDVQRAFGDLPRVATLQSLSNRFVSAGEPAGQLIGDLRLHAAQAGSDTLIVLDFDIDHTTDINGWYALSPLLVPLFVTPWVTLEIESRLEWYLVDVASGRYIARGRNGAEPVTLRSNPFAAQRKGDAIVEAQRAELVERAAHDIRLLLAATS